VAWIKVDEFTFQKPEILNMSMTLGLPETQIFGAVVLFWQWADKLTEDGMIKSATLQHIDRNTRIDGLGEALQGVGWVKVTKDGLRIPNFDRHNGQSAKKRAMTAERVKKHREKPPVKRKCNANVTPEPLPEKIREDEIREDKENNKKGRKTGHPIWVVDEFWPFLDKLAGVWPKHITPGELSTIKAKAEKPKTSHVTKKRWQAEEIQAAVHDYWNAMKKKNGGDPTYWIELKNIFRIKGNAGLCEWETWAGMKPVQPQVQTAYDRSIADSSLEQWAREQEERNAIQ